MAQSWRQAKTSESFNKGRAALRGDYLPGDYGQCKLANAQVPYWRAGKEYEKDQARANRPMPRRGAASLARVIRKMDRDNSHFVTGTKPTRREKRMAKYAAQA